MRILDLHILAESVYIEQNAGEGHADIVNRDFEAERRMAF